MYKHSSLQMYFVFKLIWQITSLHIFFFFEKKLKIAFFKFTFVGLKKKKKSK